MPDPKAWGGSPTEPQVPAAPPADSALRLARGLGSERSGREELAAPAASPGPNRSLRETLRGLDERLANSASRGLAVGTGQQIGPFFFDPQGADFTAWINHFKNEIYRNWIVPQPAILGMHGHVDFEFTVERDGRLTNLRVLKSAGNVALDRAAQNALLGSRVWALPADYGPPRLVMQVSFFYNEGPQGS